MRRTARGILIKDNKILLMYRNKFGVEYYSLIGGEIEINESAEDALFREFYEESMIKISNPKLVIIEDAGRMYGIQYIYTCQYVSGEPSLSGDSIEASITADGKNIYKPMWLDVDKLSDINLLPVNLKEMIINFSQTKFPDQPIEIVS